MDNWSTLLVTQTGHQAIDCNSLSVTILAILYSLRGPSVKSMSLQFSDKNVLRTVSNAFHMMKDSHESSPYYVQSRTALHSQQLETTMKKDHMEAEVGMQETLVTLKREMSFLPKGAVVWAAPELPKIGAHHRW